MVETIYCIHCGAEAKHPVVKSINGLSLNFCCGGCLQVYEILHEGDLAVDQGGQEMNTRIKQGETLPPARKGDGSVSPKMIGFQVEGMSCSNCVSAVERGIRSVPGVVEVSVDLENGHAMVLAIPDRVTMADMKRAVEKAGYKIPS